MISILYSPLEQFEVFFVFKNFTNLTIFLFLSTIFIVVLFQMAFQQNTFLLHNANRWGHFFEVLIEQLILLIVQNLNRKVGQLYFFWLSTFFIVIASWNLIGMVPYAFTVTSHIIVTFSLALFFFGGLNLRAFVNSPYEFLRLFVPQNVPLMLVPFLILIEIISYIARLFSLSIRLFANMMAGHTLLKILISFAFTIMTMIFNINWLFLPICFIVFSVVLLITFLEVAIALLQAYVFLVLLCLYIKDIYKQH